MPAEESGRVLSKFQERTSVTIKGPALELSKNRFDERVIK